MDKSRQVKVLIIGTAGPTVCGRKALNPRVSAMCGEGNYRLRWATGQKASAAASKEHRWLSVSDIAPPLKNGLVKASEAPKELAEDCAELQLVCCSAHR